MALKVSIWNVMGRPFVRLNRFLKMSNGIVQYVTSVQRTLTFDSSSPNGGELVRPGPGCGLAALYFTEKFSKF